MYKNILIATDGSESAEIALSHAMELAISIESAVTVVIVTEFWSGFEMAKTVAQGEINPIEAYEKHENDIADKILSAAEEIVKSKGLDYELIHVGDKHPAEGNIETASKKGCDLIVTASHGRRGIQKILLGSVASEVLTHSKIPVLIVRKN